MYQIAAFIGIAAIGTYCYRWALVGTVALQLLIFEYLNITCFVSLDAKMVNVDPIYTVCED